jgi:hypothetical protein
VEFHQFDWVHGIRRMERRGVGQRVKIDRAYQRNIQLRIDLQRRRWHCLKIRYGLGIGIRAGADGADGDLERQPHQCCERRQCDVELVID